MSTYLYIQQFVSGFARLGFAKSRAHNSRKIANVSEWALGIESKPEFDDLRMRERNLQRQLASTPSNFGRAERSLPPCYGRDGDAYLHPAQHGANAQHSANADDYETISEMGEFARLNTTGAA